MVKIIFFTYIFRAIWNVRSTKNWQLLMIPDGKGEGDDDVTTIWFNSQLNDSIPEKVKDIGKYTFRVQDEDGSVKSETEQTLRLGASYEFLFQFDESNENSRDFVTVIYRIYIYILTATMELGTTSKLILIKTYNL